MEEKLKLKCRECGRVFYGECFKELCFPCFNLKKYREATKLGFVSANSLGQRDSEAAELKPSNELTAAKTTGFSDEAALLESCWVRVQGFTPAPSESAATSLAATLFISLSKTQHIREMRR